MQDYYHGVKMSFSGLDAVTDSCFEHTNNILGGDNNEALIENGADHPDSTSSCTFDRCCLPNYHW
jgi:hypothetical protein